MFPQYVCIHKVIFLLLGQLLFSCILLFSPPEKGFGDWGWGEGCPQIFSSLPYYFWHISLWIWVWLGTARPSHSHLQTYLRNMRDRKVAPTSKVWESQTWNFQGKVLFTWLWTISRGESIISLVCSSCDSFCPGNFVSVSTCELQSAPQCSPAPIKKTFWWDCSPLWLSMIACLPLGLLVALSLTWIKNFPLCYFKLLFFKKINK